MCWIYFFWGLVQLPWPKNGHYQYSYCYWWNNTALLWYMDGEGTRMRVSAFLADTKQPVMTTTQAAIQRRIVRHDKNIVIFLFVVIREDKNLIESSIYSFCYHWVLFNPLSILPVFVWSINWLIPPGVDDGSASF